MSDIDRNARDAQGLSPAMHALYGGEVEEAERLLPDEPTVFEAAAFGLLERLRALLEEDESLVRSFSGDGFTALHLAAFMGHADAVELLLEHHANVDAVATNRFIGPVQPLHSAAARKNLECCRLLVAAGADVNARQNHGYTPLHEAAQNGDLELVRLLLGHGADPTLAKDDGMTPADLAREHGQGEVVPALLRRG